MGIQLRDAPAFQNPLHTRIQLAGKIGKDRLTCRDMVVSGNGIAFLQLSEEFTETGRLD